MELYHVKISYCIYAKYSRVLNNIHNTLSLTNYFVLKKDDP